MSLKERLLRSGSRARILDTSEALKEDDNSSSYSSDYSDNRSNDNHVEETQNNNSVGRSFSKKFAKSDEAAESPLKKKIAEKKSISDYKKDDNRSFSERNQRKDNKSFGEGLKNSQGDLVYLVRGKDRGHDAWHYVLIEKMKLPLFLRQIETGTCDVAEFGEILKSGWGENPPEEVVEEIKQNYS